MLRQSTDDAIELSLVARYGALELRELLAQLASHVCERASVLWQARTTPTRACREEPRTDPRVHTQYAHHLMNVGAGRFTDVGH